MKRTALFAAMVVVAAAATFIILHESPAQAQDAAALVGQPAPDFTLSDETGTSHTLSDYRGQVVVLEWTSSTCPIVQRHYESGGMQQLASQLMGQNVVWLAVDSTNYNTVEETVAWKAAHGFTHPTLIDQDGAVGHQYSAVTTPHMFVVDSEGVIRYQGAIDDAPRGADETTTNYVEQVVGALAAGGEVPVTSTEPYGCSVKYADAEN